MDGPVELNLETEDEIVGEESQAEEQSGEGPQQEQTKQPDQGGKKRQELANQGVQEQLGNKVLVQVANKEQEQEVRVLEQQEDQVRRGRGGALFGGVGMASSEQGCVIPFLLNWSRKMSEVGTLSSMPGGSVIVQVHQVHLEDKQTPGRLMIHDTEYYVNVVVAARYISYIEKQVIRQNSVLEIFTTSGLPGNLVLVRTLYLGNPLNS